MVPKNGRRAPVAVILAAIAFATIVPAAANEQPPLKPTLQARYDAQCREIVEGDVADLPRTVSARYEFTTADGQTLAGADAFRMFAFPIYKPKSCTVTILTLDVSGTTAFVYRRSTLEISASAGMPGTGEIVKRGERISLYVKDQWSVNGGGTPTFERSVEVRESP